MTKIRKLKKEWNTKIVVFPSFRQKWKAKNSQKKQDFGVRHNDGTSNFQMCDENDWALIQNSRVLVIEICDLEIIWNLVLVIWLLP